METRRQGKKGVRAALTALLLAVFLLAAMPLGVATVKADTPQYSGVLADLGKDSGFSVANYPERAADYSLQVIQLGESTEKELFAYVYQPAGQSKKLVASSINLSTTINDNISFLNYKLTLLSSDGTLNKYLVKEFTVLSEPTRYYAISSIYRPFDEAIDTGADHDNTVTEVNYAVNKQYCFGTINGKPYCNVVDIETITITDKFVGYVRYPNGFQLFLNSCDSHFVAFNTDKPIDKLLEADVYYTKQSYSRATMPFVGGRTEYGAKSDNYAHLKYTDKVEHTGGGWFAGTYKWDRIEKVDDFIAANDSNNMFWSAVLDKSPGVKLTDEGKAALRGKKWILRFTESEYSFIADGASGSTVELTTLVGDVTILRLKFETDGITYNLGVIDNKQTGDDKPINDEKKGCAGDVLAWLINLLRKMPWWGWLIIAIVAAAILIPVLSVVLPIVIKVVWWLLKAVFYIVASPVLLIVWIMKKAKKKDVST